MAKKKLGKEVSENSEQSRYTIMKILDGRSGGVINYGRCDSKFIDVFANINKIGSFQNNRKNIF
ncbi:hypothetical protein HZS_3958 [Henneguya salminicola]|nr:hypothetical protein HZS_3958 [Henneguya salminicola]